MTYQQTGQQREVREGSFVWKTPDFLNTRNAYNKSTAFKFGRYNCCLSIPKKFDVFTTDRVKEVDLTTDYCPVDQPMFSEETVYALCLMDCSGKEFLIKYGTIWQERKVVMMVLFVEYLRDHLSKLLEAGKFTFCLTWSPRNYTKVRLPVLYRPMSYHCTTQTTSETKLGHKMTAEAQNSILILNLPVVFFLLLFAGSLALLNNNKSRPLLKFCFNSRDQFVAAQCVLCDFYQFSATVLGCNGRTTALMSNITSTEAVCIISNCLQQVRQAQPQFTGRKKRDSSDDPVDATVETTTKDFERQEFIDEQKELSAVAPSMKELLSRYIMMDEEFMKELEDQVVDKIDVMIDAEDEDYEE